MPAFEALMREEGQVHYYTAGNTMRTENETKNGAQEAWSFVIGSSQILTASPSILA